MSDTYQKILVPMDGSKESEKALTRGIRLAKLAGSSAQLSLLNVIDTRTFQNIASFDDTMVDAVADQARQSLEQYQNQAKAAGVPNVDYLIEYGSPKAMIANDIPKELKADLIVIGATGLNVVERFVVGSVTAYVTRAAITDVLVVR